MAIAFVQANSNGSSSATSIAATYGSSQTSGNTNIIAILTGGSTQPTVSDTHTNSYSLATSASLPAQNMYLWLFIATNVAAGSSNQVTASTTGGAAYFHIIITEYSGVGSTLDGTPKSASNFGTTPATAALSTSNANDLVLGFASQLGAGGGLAAGTGYTLRQHVGSFPEIGLEDQIVTSTGSFTGAFTSPNQWWVDITLAFQAAATNVTPTVTGTIAATGVVVPNVGPDVSGTTSITGTASVGQLVSITGTNALSSVIAPLTNPIPVAISGSVAVNGAVFTGGGFILAGNIAVQGSVALTAPNTYLASGTVGVSGNVNVSFGVSTTGTIATTGSAANNPPASETISGNVTSTGTINVSLGVNIRGTVATISGLVGLSGTTVSGTIGVTGFAIPTSYAQSVTGVIATTGAVSPTAYSYTISGTGGVSGSVAPQTSTPTLTGLLNVSGVIAPAVTFPSLTGLTILTGASFPDLNPIIVQISGTMGVNGFIPVVSKGKKQLPVYILRPVG